MLIQAGLKRARLTGPQFRAFTLIEVMIAFVIFGMVSSGIIYGYVQANRIAEWSCMSAGAHAYAQHGVELARSPKWDPEANGETLADVCPATLGSDFLTNFPGTNDVPQSGA